MLSKTIVSVLALGSASLVFAQDPVAIVGVPVQNGAVPIRRNIEDLASEAGPQWDLYVQSLTAMYEVQSSDALSFFQIAGIHGYPFIEWNGTGPGENQDGWKGYCPHGESVFLPWHRPYVVLYEQTLVGHAMQIAAKYPEDRRKEYTEAATTLRAPYWDWAMSQAVPNATVSKDVTVFTAEGEKKTIKNPLFSYPYPQEALEGQYGDLNEMRPEANKAKGTYRCASGASGASSQQSYPDSANSALDRQQSLKKALYHVFTTSETYAQFASTGGRGSSLEQIHNTIHVTAACGADMLNSRVSGFEPLFMLHHANVDRLWAYWQAIKPEEANLKDSYPGGARFTTPRGDKIGPDSPLKPFHGQGGAVHTPKTVASIRTFGYSYEGLEGDKSEKQMMADAWKMIEKLDSSKRPDSTGPRSSSKPNGPRTTGGPASARPSGIPDSTRPSGNPESPQPSRVPVGPRPSGIPRPGINGTFPGVPPSSSNPNAPRPSDETDDQGNGVDGSRPTSNPNSPFPTNRPNGSRPSNTTSPGDPFSGDSPDSTDDNNGEHHYAQIQLDAEHVERPCIIHAYVGNFYSGNIAVMAQPAWGMVYGAIWLNPAIRNFAKQPTNGTSPDFINNIHVIITKPSGERIDLRSVASLKIEVDQINLSPPTGDNVLPTVERKDPVPANGGRELTPPPAPVLTDYGPRIDDGGGSGGGGGGGSGQGGDGGKKPNYGPSSAAPRPGRLSGLILALLAMITLHSML